MLFNFLNKASLGFQSGSGGEEKKAMEVASLSIAVLAFIHEHRDCLSTRQLTRFKGSVLLINLEPVVCVKVKLGKKTTLSKDKLQT